MTDGCWITGVLDETPLPYSLAQRDVWSLPYPHVLVGWAALTPRGEFRADRLEFEVGENEVADATTWAPRQGYVCVEVRLAILPVGPGGAPEAVFLSSPCTVIDGEPDWELERGDGILPARRVQREGVQQQARLVVRQLPSDLQDVPSVRVLSPTSAWEQACQEFMSAGLAISYENECSLPAPVRVDFVSARSCRSLLSLTAIESPMSDTLVLDIAPDQPMLDGHEEQMSRRADYHQYWHQQEQNAGFQAFDEHYRSPRFSLSLPLERSLFLTWRPERRLDRVLDRICNSYVQEIHGYLEFHHSPREQVKAELRDLWQGDS